MCDYSRQKYTETAFTRPYPYGLAKKMAARTVHHARTIEVWAVNNDIAEAGSTTRKRINSMVENNLRATARIASWAAMCLSPKFNFVFDADKYPDVYEPAEDSFLLADTVLSYINDMKDVGYWQWDNEILEIGCGSGIISYILKSSDGGVGHISAVDINPNAIECAKSNGIDAIQSDLFEHVEGKFDIIIFNPPYLPDDMGEPQNKGIDMALYGGKTGREVINRFLVHARDYLKKDGRIFIIISHHTGVEELKHMAQQTGYRIQQIDHFEKLTTWRLD